MSEEMSRLVLRRTSEEKGNKIAIRLDPKIDRTSDLYSLMSEGFVVEIIDVEEQPDGSAPVVTVGVNASPSFRIDRVEKIYKPRSSEEIAEESIVRFDVLTLAEAEALSLDEVVDRLSVARKAEADLKAQLDRLKLDKSKAYNLGYGRPKNAKHHEWLMLVEEIDIVSEQFSAARASAAQLRDIQKSKRYAIDHARLEQFKDHFVRLAREKMSKRAWEKLRGEAADLAEGSAAE